MGGGNKTQKAIWRSAHKGRKIKDFDRDCMRAACEQYVIHFELLKVYLKRLNLNVRKVSRSTIDIL